MTTAALCRGACHEGADRVVRVRVAAVGLRAASGRIGQCQTRAGFVEGSGGASVAPASTRFHGGERDDPRRLVGFGRNERGKIGR